jgi:hypothetical protein
MLLCVIVPTEEDLDMLISSVVVNVCMCGWEEEKKGMHEAK